MDESYRMPFSHGTRRLPDGPSMNDAAPKKSLQHSLNNPLAGLLAELQLLEMEELLPEHREAVERSIELCRRVIHIVRERVPPSMD
jgi:nitrogen-specific signal transduction histidine kinase